MFENWKVSILYRLFPFCIKSPVEKFLWKVNVSPYIILSHLLSNKGSDSHISDLIWPWSDLNAGCDTGDDLTDKGDRVDPGVRLITWHTVLWGETTLWQRKFLQRVNQYVQILSLFTIWQTVIQVAKWPKSDPGVRSIPSVISLLRQRGSNSSAAEAADQVTSVCGQWEVTWLIGNMFAWILRICSDVFCNLSNYSAEMGPKEFEYNY